MRRPAKNTASGLAVTSQPPLRAQRGLVEASGHASPQPEPTPIFLAASTDESVTNDPEESSCDDASRLAWCSSAGHWRPNGPNTASASIPQGSQGPEGPAGELSHAGAVAYSVPEGLRWNHDKYCQMAGVLSSNTAVPADINVAQEDSFAAKLGVVVGALSFNKAGRKSVLDKAEHLARGAAGPAGRGAGQEDPKYEKQHPERHHSQRRKPKERDRQKGQGKDGCADSFNNEDHNGDRDDEDEDEAWWSHDECSQYNASAEV